MNPWVTPASIGEDTYRQKAVSRRRNHLDRFSRLCTARLGRLAQPVQFVLVGATGMCVDLVVFSLLLRVVSPSVGRALAIGIAMTWNFWLNRQATFSQARRQSIPVQYALFCLACSLGAIISWSIFSGLHAGIPFFAARPIAAAFVGILASTISNYLLSKYVAFK